MAPNTLPIFPARPVNYRTKLINQVVPRDVTTQVPPLLGTAGTNGTLITSMFIRHLGNNIATVVRVYHKSESETGFNLFAEISLNAIVTGNETNALDILSFVLPDMLPAPNKGLHLEPGASLYVALGTAIASGIQVYAIGGDF